MSLKHKIQQRMDQLQQWMESNHHIGHAEQVHELTLQISKLWSALSEQDRDYVQAAQQAIEDQTHWSIK
tara:strand:+ start:4919 stop:5125 length:207 start_codon:yes stop_codon:yes gene_type:complete